MSQESEVAEAWKIYAEACVSHDPTTGQYALARLIPEQRSDVDLNDVRCQPQQ